MPEKVALVVIDLQEDFLPQDGSLAVPEGRQIIPQIEQLLDGESFPWTTVIATQDWHPKDHCSFASQHGVPPFTELEFKHPLGKIDEKSLKVETQRQIVWPDHCVQNTFGSSINEAFLKRFGELNIPKKVVKKGYLQDREYYSCFKDTWKIHKTEMEDYLRELNITVVVFVGLAYDFCVLNSAIDCLLAGFETYVVSDCCKSVYIEKIEEVNLQYAKFGIKIIPSSSVPDVF